MSFAERVDHAFGIVLLLVFATFVSGSLSPFRGWTGAITTALGVLSSTFALTTARARPRVIIWGGRLSALALLLAVIGAATHTKKVFGISALITALLLVAGALAVLRAVVTEEEVGFRTILGAVSVYMSLGLLFTFVYVGVDPLQADYFFGQPIQTGDFLFFSMTTLTTTGYGDLVPAAQPGRMISNVEMLVGQIFLVTLIARLVSMWTPGHWIRESVFPPADPKEEDEL